MGQNAKTIKLRWKGQKLPKVVDLPVPFIALSDRAGQVICNPIGEFPYEDGMKLLEICGPDGFFEAVTENGAEASPLPLCECGCGKPVSKPTNHFILGHSSQYPKKNAADSVTEGNADSVAEGGR